MLCVVHGVGGVVLPLSKQDTVCIKRGAAPAVTLKGGKNMLTRLVWTWSMMESLL